MRKLILLFALICLLACGEDKDCCDQPAKTLVKGADISFLPEIEQANVKFYDAAGVEKSLLDILKHQGVNTIRVRLWHTPATPTSSLQAVKTFASQVKAKGFKLWLTVHYSDTWADPGHQQKPAAWAEAPVTDLADSVYVYTKKIMQSLQPDIIQIGNEINGGLLWPEGSTSGENLPNCIAFLKKGAQAVRETSPTTKIMIHVAGFDVATWFYQQLATNNVDYDLIGLSYYPIWHGKNLTTVKSTIDNLGATYGKQVIIAETAYPFTLGWNDWTNNVVGSTDQLVVGYPATPEGQKQFLLKLRQIVTDSPAGAGFCYWGAEWVSFKGSEATDGSTWENQALLDFTNKAVPALEAFND